MREVHFSTLFDGFLRCPTRGKHHTIPSTGCFASLRVCSLDASWLSASKLGGYTSAFGTGREAKRNLGSGRECEKGRITLVMCAQVIDFGAWGEAGRNSLSQAFVWKWMAWCCVLKLVVSGVGNEFRNLTICKQWRLWIYVWRAITNAIHLFFCTEHILDRLTLGCILPRLWKSIVKLTSRYCVF